MRFRLMREHASLARLVSDFGAEVACGFQVVEAGGEVAEIDLNEPQPIEDLRLTESITRLPLQR